MTVTVAIAVSGLIPGIAIAAAMRVAGIVIVKIGFAFVATAACVFGLVNHRSGCGPDSCTGERSDSAMMFTRDPVACDPADQAADDSAAHSGVTG
ncbi:MAG: hypothetical protein P8Y48_04260 [Novosphingobium sp.]